VDFAGVEQFLDTPVKRYSSGMYVRLAFAVAAHLNPEILIVDEVLAVGDAEFQKKCLGKMQDVAKTGRTVLFVSHNMAAVRNLCSSCLVLQEGKLVLAGNVDDSLALYVSHNRQHREGHWIREEAEATQALLIRQVSAILEGEQPEHILSLEVTLQSLSPHYPAFIAVEILDKSGIPIMQALPTTEGFIRDSKSNHIVKLAVQLPPLIPGEYLVSIWLGSHNTHTLDFVSECVNFEVDKSPTKNRNYPHTSDHGYIVPATRLEYSN